MSQMSVPMPSPLQAQGSARRSITFGLRGLSPRDETLFKSFLRLLAHRLDADWTCVDERFEVLVAGQDAAVTHPADRTLFVGPQARQERHFVRSPFHAHELELALGRIDRVLAQSAAAAGLQAAGQGQAFKLRRWPPPELLADATRLRMASLLTGHAVTPLALQQRCGCDAATCSAFLADLERRDLLEAHAVRPAPAAAQAAAPAEAQPGLLERIRRRLQLAI